MANSERIPSARSGRRAHTTREDVVEVLVGFTNSHADDFTQSELLSFHLRVQDPLCHLLNHKSSLYLRELLSLSFLWRSQLEPIGLVLLDASELLPDCILNAGPACARSKQTVGHRHLCVVFVATHSTVKSEKVASHRVPSTLGPNAYLDSLSSRSAMQRRVASDASKCVVRQRSTFMVTIDVIRSKAATKSADGIGRADACEY